VTFQVLADEAAAKPRVCDIGSVIGLPPGEYVGDIIVRVSKIYRVIGYDGKTVSLDTEFSDETGSIRARAYGKWNFDAIEPRFVPGQLVCLRGLVVLGEQGDFHSSRYKTISETWKNREKRYCFTNSDLLESSDWSVVNCESDGIGQVKALLKRCKECFMIDGKYVQQAVEVWASTARLVKAKLPPSTSNEVIASVAASLVGSAILLSGTGDLPAPVAPPLPPSGVSISPDTIVNGETLHAYIRAAGGAENWKFLEEFCKLNDIDPSCSASLTREQARAAYAYISREGSR
jgi:hypothetical protein